MVFPIRCDAMLFGVYINFRKLYRTSNALSQMWNDLPVSSGKNAAMFFRFGKIYY